MEQTYLLGIDAGGTHTDAVLIRLEPQGATIKAWAKAKTDHNDLPKSMREVLTLLRQECSDIDLSQVKDISLGTTLAVNALVQGKTDPVGLLLSAGSGLAAERFVIGDNYTVVEGGVDHRGVEVTKLNATKLPEILAGWRKKGVQATACVGKFSPRATAHETALGQICQDAGFSVTLGHRLSGELNFPRRIATAYYNAAVKRIQNNFLDAVEKTLGDFGIKGQVRLLKADGGAIPLELARKEPVQSILSGPAASVLGILALNHEVDQGVSLLLDVGGTTTDIALIIDGSPVLDRDGMLLNSRRTLVRALASVSIGVGGDSKIFVDAKGHVTTGPTRVGPAMAFGGEEATLLDCLNVLGIAGTPSGDAARSTLGLENLAKSHNLEPQKIARAALDNALEKIAQASGELLAQINSRPIYTLAQLRSQTKVTPERVLLVGGPAPCLKDELAKKLDLPVIIPEQFAVANAVGACLTRPTQSLEVYADTGTCQLQAPKLDLTEQISSATNQKMVEKRALELLQNYMAKESRLDCQCEVLESNLFATLNDYGRSSKDIRVTCQAIPGIVAGVKCGNSSLWAGNSPQYRQYR